MGYSVSGGGVIKIPAENRAEASKALRDLAQTQREDWRPDISPGDDVAEVLTKLFSSDEDCEDLGDELIHVCFEGKTMSGLPVDEDDILEVLAPFVSDDDPANHGFIRWQGEDGGKWITRFHDGQVGNAVETYPGSPCEEDH